MTEVIREDEHKGRQIEIKEEQGSYFGYVDGEQVSKRTTDEYAMKGVKIFIDNQEFFNQFEEVLSERGFVRMSDEEKMRGYYTFESPDGDCRFKVENPRDKFDSAYIIELSHGIHGPRVERGYINQPSWGETGKNWSDIGKFKQYIDNEILE